MIDTLKTWHELAHSGNADGLDDLLADNAVFHSPVVHTPQEGKAITKAYLAAAFGVLNNDHFGARNDGRHAGGQQAPLRTAP